MTLRHRVCWALALATLLGLVAQPAAAQFTPTNNYWGVASGDWANTANWSRGFLPDGVGTPPANLGDDFAIIGGVQATPAAGISIGSATVSTVIGPKPGGIQLGVAAADSGTLLINPGGSLTVDDTAFAGNGRVVVGVAGTGTLTVARGGTLAAEELRSTGNAASLITLGSAAGAGTATVNVASANFQRMTRVIGPDVNFTASGTVILGVSSTLIADIRHAANHSPLKAGVSANAGGTLRPEFTGVAPALGNTWNIIDADVIYNDFTAIDASTAPALPLGQSYQTRKVAGGVNGQLLQLAVEQLLTLRVDRQSGALSIRNSGAAVAAANVSLDGYTVSSAHGGLNTANGVWSSLADQAVPGWQEAPSSASNLNELNSSSSTLVAGGGSRALGSPYSPMFPAFGVDPDDVSFEYTTAHGRRTGLVEYVGTKVNNNLIVNINPTTGAAQLKNDSPFAVAIEGYSIFSPNNNLRPANGQWLSLADQAITGWQEASPTTGVLSELNTSGALALSAGQSFNLGNLFTIGGTQNLTFEFLLEDAPDAVPGIVVYGAAGFTADFDDDGDVDGTDLGLWRTAFATTNVGDTNSDGDSDGADFLNWQRQLGSQAATPAAAAVPEPSTLALTAIAGALLCRRSRRRNDGQTSPSIPSGAPSGAADSHTCKRSISMHLAQSRIIRSATAVALLAWSAAIVGPGAAYGADVLLVSHPSALGASDIELITLLKDLGHTIVNEGDVAANNAAFVNGPPTSAELVGVDVILVSRAVSSDNYDDGTEAAMWNTLNVPLVSLSNQLSRGGPTGAANTNHRWGWFNTTTTVTNALSPYNYDAFPDPNHPFVVGRTTSVFPHGETIDYLDVAAGLIPPGATLVATLTNSATAGTFAGIVDIPANTLLFGDTQGTASTTGARRVFMHMTEYTDTHDIFALSANGGMILDQILNTLGGTASSRAGDVDGDGDVDVNDFNTIRTNFRTSVTSRSLGDLTGDGMVNMLDFRQWKDNDPLATGITSGAVPEPAGWALAAFGVAAVTAVRRRRGVSISLPQSGEATNKKAGVILEQTARIGRLATVAALAAGVAMGIGEAKAANIAWVSFHAGDDAPTQAAIDEGYTQAPDVGYTNLLTTAGHSVTRFVTVNDVNANTTLIDQLNAPAIDLVIISRSVDSAHYQTAAEATTWNNTITKPMMIMGGYVLRQSRLGFVGNEVIPDTTGPVKLTTAVPGHPIFAGIALDGANTMVNDYSTAIPILNTTQNPNTAQRGISVNELPIDNDGAGGTLIASLSVPISAGGNLVVAEWAAGTSITKDTGAQPLSNRRMVFLSGSREQGTGGTSQQAGMFDLAPDGQTMFVNAVAYMGGPGFQPGDVDNDGDVDIFDFNAIRDHFQQTVTMRSQGDIAGGDGFVDWKDFRQWKDNHPFPASPAGGAVPEPAGMVLALVAIAAVARYSATTV